MVRNYFPVFFYHWKQLKLIGRITRKMYLNWNYQKYLFLPPKSVIDYLKWSQNNKYPAGNFYELDSAIFQTDSSKWSCKKSKAWKWLETKLDSRQGLSRNTIKNCSEINSWEHFFQIRYNLDPDSTWSSLCDSLGRMWRGWYSAKVCASVF